LANKGRGRVFGGRGLDHGFLKRKSLLTDAALMATANNVTKVHANLYPKEFSQLIVLEIFE